MQLENWSEACMALETRSDHRRVHEEGGIFARQATTTSESDSDENDALGGPPWRRPSCLLQTMPGCRLSLKNINFFLRRTV